MGGHDPAGNPDDTTETAFFAIADVSRRPLYLATPTFAALLAVVACHAFPRHGVVPAPVQSGVAMISDLAQLPIETQRDTLPDGSIIIAVSRQSALASYLRRRQARIDRVVARLELLAREPGRWADDAVVIRGYIATLTAQRHTRAVEAQCRSIVRHGGATLEPWTERKIRQVPLLIDAGEDASGDGGDIHDQVTKYFARHLVASVLVRAGPTRARRELKHLEESGHLPGDTSANLQRMIDVYREYHP